MQTFLYLHWAPTLKFDKSLSVKIPFIIFVNTESVGSNGYMSWEELKEILKFDFVHIGNHSHTHGYLVDKSDAEIKKDIKISIKLFEEKLNHKT